MPSRCSPSAELASGRHREVVADLEALVAAHPFRERFCAQLMVALYRSGRQAEALAAYAAARERLADELGLDPGPELQALSQRVLRQDPSCSVTPTSPRPLLPGPRPACARSAPPTGCRLRGARAGAARGPGDRARRRVATAWQAVAHGGRRLVLLSGDAGIGKSHLAAGLVHRATDEGRRCWSAGATPRRCPTSPSPPPLRSSPEVDEVLHDAPASVAARAAPLLDGPRGRRSRDPARAAGGPGGLGIPSCRCTRRSPSCCDGWPRCRPVLLVVENAERIDRASALLLRTLLDPPAVRHPHRGHLPGPTGWSAPAAAGAARGPGPAVEVDRITLGPLTRRELADLVRDTVPDIDGHADRFWQHTGGNPFYAKEMAQVLAERRRRPPRVGRAARRPRRAAPPTDGAVGADAARCFPWRRCWGSTVDVELLAQVVRLPEDRVGRPSTRPWPRACSSSRARRGRAATPCRTTSCATHCARRSPASRCGPCTCGPPRR